MTEKPSSPNFNVVTVTASNKNTTNIADVLTQTTGTTSTIAVGGFYEKDDIDYGTLQFIASSMLQHDGGTVIDPNAPSPALDLNAYLSYVSTGPGRWVRKLGDRVPIEWFGAKKNDEEFDNSLPINKALESPHIKGRELFFSKGFYVVKSTLTISIGNITIAGSGKYDTFIVGYKSGIANGAISPLVVVQPGADSTTIKDLGLKPWNYPSRHEEGWTDRFRFVADGQIRYANNVGTINRGINNNDPDFFELDLTNFATTQLFPAHWYLTLAITKTILQCGGLMSNNPNLFKTSYRTITVAPSQTVDIVDTFTVSDLPPGFDMEKWNISVRIIQTGSIQKGGLTIPSNNNAAMLPAGFGTPAVGVKINATVVYNFDSTFTVTFKFKDPVSSDFSGLAPSNISGSNYVLPYAIDLCRMLVDLEINNVFIDGMWYAGPSGIASGATNRIGIDDALWMYSVKNIRVLNCNFENFCNAAISMKDVFELWDPLIQTKSVNRNILIKNTQFRRGGISGIDIEGNDVTLEDCKLLDIMNIVALRYGSRSFGVQHEKYLFRNCDCYLDPKGNGSAAASIQLHFGISSVKKVVYDSCTFSIASYLTDIPSVIGIRAALDSADSMIIKNCTFNGIYRTVQMNGKINNVVISDCQSINNAYNNGAIFYAAGASTHVGLVDIRNHFFERISGYTHRLIAGNPTTVVDKNQLVRCNAVLSETATLDRCLISYNIYRTFFNNLHSVSRNIIEHVVSNVPWTITFGSVTNLSNFLVDSTLQKYKYAGKNIELYFKVTADVAVSGIASSFTFTLPVSVASGVTDLYGTCTFISSSNTPVMGAVVYGTTTVGRVRLTPIGTGTATFWIQCEYEF
jgi:hypothetical protein